MSKIVCLKLTTGEEIICNEVETDHYDNIASIIMVPSQGSQQVGLGLAPFMPYTEESKFCIEASKIVCKGTPTKEMLNNYNRIYGSGIQIASTLQGL